MESDRGACRGGGDLLQRLYRIQAGGPAAPVVLLSEEHETRARILCDIVRERLRALTRTYARFLEAQHASRAPRAAGIVGLAPEGPERSFETARSLASSGVPVLCYGERDAFSYPLRCRAVASGAVRLAVVRDSPGEGDLVAHVERFLALTFGGSPLGDELGDIMASLGISVRSEALDRAFAEAERFGRTRDVPILITGETGTGKSLVARAIGCLDPVRRSAGMVSLNCSAVPPELFESELFGYRRGAFTGAVGDHKGYIERARGGILFLDEIGDLPLTSQAKLLCVLDERRFVPLGGEKEQSADVRFVAATHRDLRAMVEAGTFRRDLFHRINKLSLHLPPLRERLEDVPALVRCFLERYKKRSPGGCFVPENLEVTEGFLEALMATGLLGNARDVDRAVLHALTHLEGRGRLEARDVPADLFEAAGESRPAGTAAAQPLPAGEEPSGRSFDLEVELGDLFSRAPPEALNLEEVIRKVERAIVKRALQLTGGKRVETAGILGISRRALYSKLRSRGIEGE